MNGTEGVENLKRMNLRHSNGIEVSDLSDRRGIRAHSFFDGNALVRPLVADLEEEQTICTSRCWNEMVLLRKEDTALCMEGADSSFSF